MFKIETKTYSFAPVNHGEISRYAGAKNTDENLKSVIGNCIAECERENAVQFAVCYAKTPVKINGNEIDFSAFKLKSQNLATAINGANSTLVFACTIGVGIDRLIKKYSEINPIKALVFQALGSERVESFIEVFIEDYEKSYGVKLSPRFSAGYGDLSLSAQKDIFSLLNPQKHLGLTLNDSLLMSPSKSVTAFAGINKESEKADSHCKDCQKEDCEFRS